MEIISGPAQGQATKDDRDFEDNRPTTKFPTLAQEFLPEYLEIIEKPPSRIARILAILIIVIIASVLLWAYFGKVDIIASAPGRFVVDSKSKIIQAPAQGEVSFVHVRDGDSVKKGDTLIELNPTIALAERTRLREKKLQWALATARLEAMLADSPLTALRPPEGAPDSAVLDIRNQIEADVALVDQQRSSLQGALSMNLERQAAERKLIGTAEEVIAFQEKQIAAIEPLLESKVYSQLRFDQLLMELLKSRRTLEQDRANLLKLIAEEKELRQKQLELEAELRKDNFDKLLEAKMSLADASEQFVQGEDNARMMTIVAPVNGIVQQLTVSSLGSVVQSGQSVLVVVPKDENIEAEVKIMSKDVGFVKPGQQVEVKIDSFPYTTYGTAKGTLRTISSDSVEDEDFGLVYPARVALAQRSITHGNISIPFSPGMSVIGEIKTGDRRVIDYLMRPLKRYTSEAMRER